MTTIGVDWGSTSFRAYCFDDNGTVLNKIEHRSGILNVENRKFEDTLFNHLGDFVQAGDRIILSGMITSRNGWFETSYAELPVGIDCYLANGVYKKVRDVDLVFLPGVCQRVPADVIRGEELQIFGICSNDDAIMILPGTHSKLALVEKGEITGFQTTMTGEVYDILMNQSLVGGIAYGNNYIEASFLKGIDEGAATRCNSVTLLSKIFTTRAAVLLDQLEAKDVASYLSGLLIGSELNSSLAKIGEVRVPLYIIGDSMLCDRYATALNHLGQHNHEIKPDAAVQGFGRLISRLNR